MRYHLDWRLDCRCSGLAWDVTGKGGAVGGKPVGHLARMTLCSATGCLGLCVCVCVCSQLASERRNTNWPWVKMTST